MSVRIKSGNAGRLGHYAKRICCLVQRLGKPYCSHAIQTYGSTKRSLRGRLILDQDYVLLADTVTSLVVRETSARKAEDIIRNEQPIKTRPFDRCTIRTLLL